MIFLKKRCYGLLIDLLTNRFLIVAVSSWMLSQLTKVIIHWIVNKKFVLERMFGDGGMPSTHSATVCSLATFSALACGFGSFEFAVTAIFALVVCRDAMGVRRETGKQATVLNDIIKSIEKHDFSAIKLKEFVGHTPAQVAVGSLLGITNAIVWYFTGVFA